MSGSFFGLDCEMPQAPGFDDNNELVKADEDEGEIDIFNDETFGDLDNTEFDIEEQNRHFQDALEAVDGGLHEHFPGEQAILGLLPKGQQLFDLFSNETDIKDCSQLKADVGIDDPAIIGHKGNEYVQGESTPTTVNGTGQDNVVAKLMKLMGEVQLQKAVPSPVPNMTHPPPQALTVDQLEEQFTKDISSPPPPAAIPHVSAPPPRSAPFNYPPPPHHHMHPSSPPRPIPLHGPFPGFPLGRPPPPPFADMSPRQGRSFPGPGPFPPPGFPPGMRLPMGTPPFGRFPMDRPPPPLHPEAMKGRLPPPPPWATPPPMMHRMPGNGPNTVPMNRSRMFLEDRLEHAHMNDPRFSDPRRGRGMYRRPGNSREYHDHGAEYGRDSYDVARHRQYSEGYGDSDEEEESEGEEDGEGKPKDPYSGLMTKRDKDWIIRIQLMQLQTDNPYIDDYYYTMSHMKKLSKERAKKGENAAELTLVLPQFEGRTDKSSYQPVQFANTLGRLTSGSVHNPRKIIDVQVDHSHEEGRTPETRRFKQLLLDIEHAYDMLLMIDDMEKRALALPEDARPQIYNEREAGLSGLYISLQLHQPDLERLKQIVSVSKGLKLVVRLMPLLDKERSAKLLHSLLLLTDALQSSKRLVDTLPTIIHPLLAILPRPVTLPSLLQCTESLAQGVPLNGDEGSSPKVGSAESVARILKQGYGARLIWALMVKGEEVYSNTSPLDLEKSHQLAWKEFVGEVAEYLMERPSHLVSPSPSDSKILFTHFDRLLDRGSFLLIEDVLEQWCSPTS